jgi:hypothetical protein
MASSIPQINPPTAYERFVVAPVSKVVRVALAIFKFIAAIVTWPFKAIYRLFAKSESIDLNKKGCQDISPQMTRIIASNPPNNVQQQTDALVIASNPPNNVQQQTDALVKDLKRTDRMVAMGPCAGIEYSREDWRKFFEFLQTQTGNDAQRTQLYFYLHQESMHAGLEALYEILKKMGRDDLFIHDLRDDRNLISVTYSDKFLVAEQSRALQFDFLEDHRIYKKCFFRMVATINKDTLEVDLKATIELSDP